MESRNEPRRPVIEVMDDDMARVIRAKSGAERLAIASGLYASARRMLMSYLRSKNPDWDESRVVREAARRMSHGAF
jgi:Rv0078B-related antitoxin